MGTHMKTTIDLADDLYTRARQLAERRKTTLRAVIEDGIRLALQEAESAPPPVFKMVTWPGGLTEEYQAKGLYQAIHDSYPTPEEIMGSLLPQAVQDRDRD
jgi:hypothetical protein